MENKTTNTTLKKIVNLTEKTRDLSLEGVEYIRKTPIHKLAAGTAVILIPGALTAVGAYALGKKIISGYKEYKKKEKNKEVGFVEWFNRSSTIQVKSNIRDIRKKSQPIANVINKKIDKIWKR